MRPYRDIVGVGFGPANIALAIALVELRPEAESLFLEAQSKSHWHPNAMFSGADIQNHPLRDLVTPRNPKSHFTFVNFLKEQGRLFEFLNLGVTFPLRTEYAQYLLWAASHFNHCVRNEQRVASITAVFDSRGEHLGYRLAVENGTDVLARSVVVAPGRTAYVPGSLASLADRRVVHFTQLLQRLKELEEAGRPLERFAVVGSSQSAVEVTLALRERYPDAKIHNVLRTYGFRQKDLSPFTGEVFFPEYCDLYFEAERTAKEELDADLRYTNYSAADSDILDQLYLKLYEDKYLGRQRGHIYNLCALKGAAATDAAIALELEDRCRAETLRLEVDVVVAATGFRDLGDGPAQERVPPLLRGLEEHLELDHHGCVVVQRNYAVRVKQSLSPRCPVVLNGLCEKTHGMGDAGSFSLLSLRAERILSALAPVLERVSQNNDTYAAMPVA